MMKILISLLLCTCTAVSYGQRTAREILLHSIESNNLVLKAERDLVRARSLEARSGASLPDPTIGYDYMWGSPKELGKTGELNVVQGFDFPGVYISRSRLASKLGEGYQLGYAAMRQQTLLEAELALIDMQDLRKRLPIMAKIAENANNLSQLYARKVETGEAGVLEKNKADVELLNAHYNLHLVQIEMEGVIARLVSMNGGEKLPEMEFDSIEPLPSLPDIESLLVLYMASDPHLESLRKATDVAYLQINVAKGESLPRFEVGYRREHAAGETFNGIKMGMSIPIFESRHKVQRARAEQMAANAGQRNGEAELEISLRQLHAKAKLLYEAHQDRSIVMDPHRNITLLDKALETGHISLESYYNEVASIYQMFDSQLNFERDYRKAVAQLMMIEI